MPPAFEEWMQEMTSRVEAFYGFSPENFIKHRLKSIGPTKHVMSCSRIDRPRAFVQDQSHKEEHVEVIG